MVVCWFTGGGSGAAQELTSHQVDAYLWRPARIANLCNYLKGSARKNNKAKPKYLLKEI